MSATVRIRSIFSRSRLCTIAAKSRMVLRSVRSRDCAVMLIRRWCSTSQATVSVCAGVEAEARAEPAGDARAGDRMILRPALGDVVQEERDVEDDAVLEAGHDLVGERMGVGEVAALDLGEHADRRG